LGTTDNIEQITLITGGARSGKSKLAESLVRGAKLPVVYLATMALPDDDEELKLRISKHRGRRPSDWHTIEEPLMVSQQVLNLPKVAAGRGVCLIDCLSLFVSNLLLSIPAGLSSSEALSALEDNVLKEIDALLSAIKSRTDYAFVIVTNEVGLAVVPEVQLARIYRDLLGLANQKAAEMASTVYICFAGLPLKLK
jgi:adenosylcobinamide kinase/adenosylcobinamide-phosphate guanylyltransferase